MNIKDFSDLNEKLAKESELTPELVNFIAFALTIMVSCIIFILLG